MGAIFDQKVAAIRSRIEPRDLFDIVAIMESYGGRLGDDQVRWAGTYLAERERVRERYAEAFERDEILKDLTTINRTLAQFREATSTQQRLRALLVQYQRIPVPAAVLGRVYAYESRQRAESLQRADPEGLRAGVRRAGPPSVRRGGGGSTKRREEDLDWSLSR